MSLGHDDFVRALSNAIEQPELLLSMLVGARPQTNDVGRSAPIAYGLMVLAQSTDAGLGVIELGSSAGINLCLSRYSLEIGDEHVGERGSPVRVRCNVTRPTPGLGGDLLSSRLEQVVGLDVQPIDLRVASERERLSAATWPDAGYYARQRAAIDECCAAAPDLRCADARTDLSRLMSAMDSSTAVCLVTSWVWDQLDSGTRRSVVEQVSEVSRRREVWWLAVESASVLQPEGYGELDRETRDPFVGTIALARCTSSMDFVVLGTCHPYGRWISPADRRSRIGIPI